jgi:hypothetical protein
VIAALARLSRIFAWAGGALLLAAAVLIGADVLLRNALRVAPSARRSPSAWPSR